MNIASTFSPARLWAIVVKEFIQMRRDRVTFGMMVGIPLLQLTAVRLCHQLGSEAPGNRRAGGGSRPAGANHSPGDPGQRLL